MRHLLFRKFWPENIAKRYWEKWKFSTTPAYTRPSDPGFHLQWLGHVLVTWLPRILTFSIHALLQAVLPKCKSSYRSPNRQFLALLIFLHISLHSISEVNLFWVVKWSRIVKHLHKFLKKSKQPFGMRTNPKLIRDNHVHDNQVQYYVHDNQVQYYVQDNQVQYYVQDNQVQYYVHDNQVQYSDWFTLSTFLWLQL
jgi:hypothetical protein